MRRRNDDLQRYTWDQAAIAGMCSSDSFTALGYNPSTVRRWAMCGHIKPAGKGPNGAILYLVADVVQAAKRERQKSPGRPAKAHRCNSTEKNAQ